MGDEPVGDDSWLLKVTHDQLREGVNNPFYALAEFCRNQDAAREANLKIPVARWLEAANFRSTADPVALF